MSYSDWINLIVSVISGLAVAIPALISLVKVINAAAKEKNWAKIIDIALDYMETAEKNFESGADRKDWVLSMVATAAQQINYDYNAESAEKISSLIDKVCAAANTINNAGKNK